jgi:hypothetical protein
MSRGSIPIIPFVLLAYEKMDRHLVKVSKGATYGPAVRRAALAGRGKLLKYKTLSENNQFYTIAKVCSLVFVFDISLKNS